MISGEDSTRLLREVLKGITTSADDSAEEAAHRKALVADVKTIQDKGGTVDVPKEWV